jgi:hypothetical protein
VGPGPRTRCERPGMPNSASLSCAASSDVVDGSRHTYIAAPNS